MSIWAKLFNKKPKPYTIELRFLNAYSIEKVITHSNVIRSRVWFRVLNDTPGTEPVVAIHMIDFANGSSIMYRDDHDQKLMEFKSE